MRRVSVFILCLTLLVLVGAEVGSASAAGDLEISAEGKPLEVGAPITTASSTGMTVRTSDGVITCEESTMAGTLTSNDTPKDGLQFTEAAFRRHVPYGPQCASTLALGEPTVTARGLPWSLDLLTSKADGKFKGSKKVGLALAFPEVTCVMEGTKGTVTFPLPMGEEELPLELSLSGVTLKRAKGSEPPAPARARSKSPQ